MQYRMNTEEKNGKLMRMEATFEFPTPLIAELVHSSLCQTGAQFSTGNFRLNGAAVSVVIASGYDYEGLHEDASKAFTEKAEAFGKDAVAKEKDFLPVAGMIQGLKAEIAALSSTVASEIKRGSEVYRSLRDRVDFLEESTGTSLDGEVEGPSLRSLSKGLYKTDEEVSKIWARIDGFGKHLGLLKRKPTRKAAKKQPPIPLNPKSRKK